MKSTKESAIFGFKDEATEVMDMLSNVDLGGQKAFLAFLFGVRYGQTIRTAEQERVSA